MLLQIGMAALMAVSVPDGLGKNSVWFALSYALMRTILVMEYLRTRRNVPAARQLTTRYSIGFFYRSRNMVCIYICTYTN
jgi:low temperature requirement protein LtrA